MEIHRGILAGWKAVWFGKCVIGLSEMEGMEDDSRYLSMVIYLRSKYAGKQVGPCHCNDIPRTDAFQGTGMYVLPGMIAVFSNQAILGISPASRHSGLSNLRFQMANNNTEIEHQPFDRYLLTDSRGTVVSLSTATTSPVLFHEAPSPPESPPRRASPIKRSAHTPDKRLGEPPKSTDFRAEDDAKLDS